VIDVNLPMWEVVARLSLAILAGGVLGWERESKEKPAGFRTMMMVALGSATFTVIAMLLYQDALRSDPSARVDYIRIIEGVAGGIGFLGAGTIIRQGGTVDGVTTAATIWVVGAAGVACGVGSYALAGVTVALALVILVLMRLLEERHSPKS
jgi:putative Mg2+ transporter-C (MgtC) family protein